ncbi:hypothetical protein CF392_04925 [Tamilnaduibacter salinus]|uniref:Uncharacterized protein n=1 Tax=Tamilnaduibacter salinus TaxID=1484056 RepID=A0A2A2I691_9GAMM|nr:hypothetical protein [Tamilnaduibacter salinus]PAV26553.1 hypothetical protein CF392_04925 [Tamilnaduibacter salinus]
MIRNSIFGRLALTPADSIKEPLNFLYHRFRHKTALTQQSFKNAFATRFDVRGFSDLRKAVHRYNTTEHPPIYSPAYSLLDFKDLLAELLSCTDTEVAETLDIFYFSQKGFKPYFVALRERISGSGPTDALSDFLDTSHLGVTIVLVLARNEIDARAIALNRINQPINPSRFMSPLNLADSFDEDQYAPMIGTVFSDRGPTFQASSPLKVILELDRNRSPITEIMMEHDTSRFHAAAYYDEASSNVRYRKHVHRLIHCFGLVDTKRETLVSEDSPEYKSSQRDHPLLRDVEFCMLNPGCKIIHHGLGDIFQQFPDYSMSFQDFLPTCTRKDLGKELLAIGYGQQHYPISSLVSH